MSIKEILPDNIEIYEILGEPKELIVDPREKYLAKYMVPQRALEFLAGRFAAQCTLNALGVSGEAVLRGKAGEPIWPEGVVGSITHCKGYVAAATGVSALYASIGIDVEIRKILPEETIPYIFNRLDIDKYKDKIYGNIVGSIMFSAKESVIKAYYFLNKKIIHFNDISIILNDEHYTFDAFIADEPITHLNGSPIGRYAISDKFIFTSYVVENKIISVGS